jgi:hypothetical protein
VPVRHRNRRDILPVKEAGTDPPIICPLPIELTNHRFAADKSNHEGARITADPCGSLWSIQAVQANRGPGHNDCVHVAHDHDTALDGSVGKRGRGEEETEDHRLPNHRIAPYPKTDCKTAPITPPLMMSAIASMLWGDSAKG